MLFILFLDIVLGKEKDMITYVTPYGKNLYLNESLKFAKPDDSDTKEAPVHYIPKNDGSFYIKNSAGQSLSLKDDENKTPFWKDDGELLWNKVTYPGNKEEINDGNGNCFSNDDKNLVIEKCANGSNEDQLFDFRVDASQESIDEARRLLKEHDDIKNENKKRGNRESTTKKPTNAPTKEDQSRPKDVGGKEEPYRTKSKADDKEDVKEKPLAETSKVRIEPEIQRAVYEETEVVPTQKTIYKETGERQVPKGIEKAQPQETQVAYVQQPMILLKQVEMPVKLEPSPTKLNPVVQKVKETPPQIVQKPAPEISTAKGPSEVKSVPVTPEKEIAEGSGTVKRFLEYLFRKKENEKVVCAVPVKNQSGDVSSVDAVKLDKEQFDKMLKGMAKIVDEKSLPANKKFDVAAVEDELKKVLNELKNLTPENTKKLVDKAATDTATKKGIESDAPTKLQEQIKELAQNFKVASPSGDSLHGGTDSAALPISESAEKQLEDAIKKAVIDTAGSSCPGPSRAAKT